MEDKFDSSLSPFRIKAENLLIGSQGIKALNSSNLVTELLR
jgi:hypothetical protein